MVKYLKKRILTQSIFIILCVFSYTANAQSKHAIFWNINNYCLDFSSTQPQYIKLPKGLTRETVWYNDLHGNLKIVMSRGKMHIVNDKKIIKTNSKLELSLDLEEINSQYEFSMGYFIPVPNNTQQVYYVEPDKYYLIDIQQKTIKLRDNNINLRAQDFIKVHHPNCDKIWLINTDKKIWTYYLLDSDGIKKVKEITLSPSDYKIFPPNSDWIINLSKDCTLYTMVYLVSNNNNDTEVYYGKFDRENGVFTRISSYNFGSKYSYVANSIIAPDNSRIYYFVKTKDGYAQVLEVPIKNGIPDYKSISKPLYSERHTKFYYRSFDYGYDGKIYLIDQLRKIFTIEINKQGKTVLTPKDNLENENYTRHHPFLSSWFMDNPCEEIDAKNPCATQKPSVEFDNSLVCYGQPLKLKLSGNAPFEVFYTLDNEEKKIKTSNTEYVMPNVAGKYKITKIKDSVCEFYPTENNISEIANEIKELKIIAE